MNNLLHPARYHAMVSHYKNLCREWELAHEKSHEREIYRENARSILREIKRLRSQFGFDISS